VLWALAIVLGAASTLLAHEVSHALVVKHSGGWITSFKPYPHWDETKRFWFGRVTYEWHTSSFTDTRWRHGSPLLFNTPMAILYAIAAYLWCPYLWVLSGWAVVDHLWWWRGYLGTFASAERWKRLDGYKFKYFAAYYPPWNGTKEK